MPSDPHLPRRPGGPHRARGGRSSLSLRLAMLVGVTAVLAGSGIAVASGVVQTPLSDSQQAPEAATLAPSVDMAQPSASANSYALATLPASMRPHAAASATTSAKATPTAHPSAKPSTTPSAAPSTAQSSSAASNLLTPQPTAEYETPTGQNELAWSEAILTGLGDPLTSANITSIGYWMQNEAGSPPAGIVGANNPINCSEPGYGGTQIQYEAPGYYLMSYPTVQDGVAAIAAYLNSGSYPLLLSDLQQGVGLSDPGLASELLEYSGSGYSTIPDSWGASQGTPPS